MKDLIMCIGKALGKLLVTRIIHIEDEECDDTLKYDPTLITEVQIAYNPPSADTGFCGNRQIQNYDFSNIEEFDHFIERMTRLQKKLKSELKKD